MPTQPDFDLGPAHEYFSAHCFNQTWDHIDKPSRDAKEDEAMLLLAMSSLWHWTQREDCTPKNFAIGYWQVSRVYALLGQADNSRHFGRLSLDLARSNSLAPFYVGYAYEALARAELVAGNKTKMEEHLKEARGFAEQVTEADDKQLLIKDLDNIGTSN